MTYKELCHLLKASAAHAKRIEPESPMWAEDLEEGAKTVEEMMAMLKKYVNLLEEANSQVDELSKKVNLYREALEKIISHSGIIDHKEIAKEALDD